MQSRKLIKNKFALFIGISLATILLITLSIITPIITKLQKKIAFESYSEMTKASAGEINTKLTEFQQLINTFAYTLEQYDYANPNREEVIKTLKYLLENNREILGICVGFEPNAFDNKDSQFHNFNGCDETGRFIPYWSMKDEKPHLTTLTGMETEDWYQIPFKTGQFTVLEPFKYEDILMISMVNPLRLNGDTKNTIGIAGIDISLEFMNDLATSNVISENGYGMIVSNTGVYVSHPTRKDWVGQKSLLETDFAGNKTQSILADIKKGKKGMAFLPQSKTEKKSMIFYSPVEIGKYAFIAVVPLSDILAGTYRLIYILIILCCIFIVLGSLFAMGFAKRISNPIIKALKFTQALADGDLNYQINLTSNDEVGLLIDGINKMKVRFSSIIDNVKSSANSVSTAGRELNSTSQQLSEGANQQASSIEEVSSSIEQISSSIQQNAENAQQTEKIARQAAIAVEEGSEATNKALTSMKAIAGKTNIINDIAFQTNLLALNAAVEAARAGEHGKGFAVVAAEVRKLAERSKIAADEINELLKSGVVVADKAGQKLTEVVPEINKTYKLVEEISSTCKEQKSGATQIDGAIQQVNNSTQQNAAASEEVASSSEELSKQAETLLEQVSFFKIDQKNKSTINQSQKKTTKKPLIKEDVILPTPKQVTLDLSIGDKEDEEFETF